MGKLAGSCCVHAASGASVQVELKKMCTGNLPLQVDYAVGRLVAVIVYCFRQ